MHSHHNKLHNIPIDVNALLVDIVSLVADLAQTVVSHAGQVIQVQMSHRRN